MLLEIQMRNITVQAFVEANFSQTQTAEILAAHINGALPVFEADKDGIYSVGYEFTKRADNDRTDVTLCMSLNKAAAERLTSNAETAANDIKRMEEVAGTSMKIKPDAISISVPSLRKA